MVKVGVMYGEGRGINLTNDVAIGEFEWFQCVETGKGHQMETAVH